MTKKVRRKVVKTKTSTKPVEKPTGKSRTARTKAETITAPAPRQKDQFGFMEGTDSSIAAHALAEGGADRVTIYDKIRDQIESNSESGLQTRNGTEKNIPNLVATVLKQMRDRGWVVESTWRVVLDPDFVPEGEDAAEEPAEAPESAEEPETEPEDVEPAPKPKKARRVRRGSSLG